MRFSFRKPDLSQEKEDQYIEIEEPEPVEPDTSSKPTGRKRKMLAISQIDPDLLSTLKTRAKTRQMPLYAYCCELLRCGLKVEDMFTKPRPKSRQTTGFPH